MRPGRGAWPRGRPPPRPLCRRDGQTPQKEEASSGSGGGGGGRSAGRAGGPRKVWERVTWSAPGPSPPPRAPGRAPRPRAQGCGGRGAHEPNNEAARGAGRPARPERAAPPPRAAPAPLPPGPGSGGHYRRAAAAAAAAASQRWRLLQPGSARGSVRRGVEEAAGRVLRAGGAGEEGAGGDGAALEGGGTGGGGSVRGEDLDVRARGGGGGGGGGEAGAGQQCPFVHGGCSGGGDDSRPLPTPGGHQSEFPSLSSSSPPRPAPPSPFSLFSFLFFRTARAPGAKNNRGSGERRVPAARIPGPEGGWRRRGRPMQRIARRRRQPGCCGRQLKNGSRKLLLTMNEGIRFTRQGPPAKLRFPAGFSNHICISPPPNPPRTVPAAHWAAGSGLTAQSRRGAAACWFPLATVHHGYRGDRGFICIGLLDWLGESRIFFFFFRRRGKALPSLPRKTTPRPGPARSPPARGAGAADLGRRSAPRRLSAHLVPSASFAFRNCQGDQGDTCGNSLSFGQSV
ncbi:uncharacterized protein [Canis lupus baileyi]|uniref:uncharacterized protein n=1 Tax=Canis lupus baileyi TaxID=143281 RepID=UPI003B978B04